MGRFDGQAKTSYQQAVALEPQYVAPVGNYLEFAGIEGSGHITVVPSTGFAIHTRHLRESEREGIHGGSV